MHGQQNRKFLTVFRIYKQDVRVCKYKEKIKEERAHGAAVG
jgi:hypothetical protein